MSRSAPCSRRAGAVREAAAVYARAAAIDPRYRAKSRGVPREGGLAAVPAEFRAMPTAPTVTRAELAALDRHPARNG